MSGLVEKAIEETRAGYPYPEILRETEETIRSLADSLQILSPSRGRLLDIGCGNGSSLLLIHDRFKQCHGVDITQSSLDEFSKLIVLNKITNCSTGKIKMIGSIPLFLKICLNSFRMI